MNPEKENGANVPNLKDAHFALITTLGDKGLAQYNSLMKLFFNMKITRLKFDEEARKLLCTSEKIHLHNRFLLALSNKTNPGLGPPRSRATPFGNEEYSEESENSLRYAVQERHLPDEELVRARVLVMAFQHDLGGADEEIATLLVQAVKLYIKNILTAVVTKFGSYKLRERNFQHSMGFPVPDPWLRNYSNIVNESGGPTIEMNEDSENIQPAVRGTLENVQQQTAFEFSCAGSPVKRLTKIGLMSLYETLLENPSVINNHTIYSINLERILTKLDNIHL